MAETKTLLSRCKEFFGMKPGETMTEFLTEVKSLTPKDKQDFVDWFNAAGMPTVLKAE